MAQTYIYKGRFKNTSDILYTWDGKHLYKGRFTNDNDILYTFDGKYLYRGRFTNINDVLYSVHGNNVYRGRYNDISNLKSERESVKNSIKSSYPEYLDLIEPKPINIESTGKLLKPSEVLVNWYFGDKKSFVWAISQSGLSSFASINLTKKDFTIASHIDIEYGKETINFLSDTRSPIEL